MSDLETAIRIAVEAHAGQVDKAGAPYILHPLRVMLSLSGEAERIAGVLHDVVEDCEGWSLERLRAAGFPEAVIAGIEAVTKREGESYPEFCRRAGRNAIGRAVKIADLRDNLAPARQLANDADTRWRIEKYRAALAILEG